ncbi:MATE family efflux transporter [Pontibacter sp. G13]|uniref:MATE family efflux transporter n=1 Tax=Pontibacter sp. G13 TaxID=3074898 RepID=UPI00288C3EFC|nr:MATE family efflux transporter [Pontibacter sp. G13]WNJ16473.1 MATE family efflux transporter [Pontibacter sp. G13]
MNRTILKLAIPNILSNLTVPLLGIVDTALMGRLDDPKYLGAVGVGSMVLIVIYWGFGFLRMGTTGMTAQAFGANDKTQQMTLLGQALTVAWLGAAAILLLQYPIELIGFQIIEGDPEVIQLAKEYYGIRIWAAPATIGLYALTGWFLGMQKAQIPMILTIIVNILNVIGNFAFVYGFGMKSDGVALSTVIAQYVGLIVGLAIWMRHYRPLLQLLDRAKLVEPSGLKRFFTVNANIFVRTILLTLAFSFFTAKSSAQDKTTLAANQILIQFFHMMAYAVDGFAFAAEALVGRYVGARDGRQFRKALRYLFIWGCGFGAIFSLVYAVTGTHLLRLFTDQAETIAAAEVYLPWLIGFPIAAATAFMWDGVYIGATATVSMRNTMIVSFVIYLATYYLTFPIWGNHGLWLSMLVFMVARSVTLTILAPRQIWQLVPSSHPA